MVSSLPQTVPILAVELAGVHQRLDEVRQQQDVRIQGQDPVAAGEPDGLVLRRGEADVLVVVEDLAAIFELLQDVDGAVGGGVVDDDDFLIRVPLGQHGFEAALDEAAAVVGHYRDGYEVVMRHEQEPESPECTTYP